MSSFGTILKLTSQKSPSLPTVWKSSSRSFGPRQCESLLMPVCALTSAISKESAMARRIASRLLISGRLVACGPLHVGGAEDNSDVDLALAVNGRGAFYVPGTSLAGAIRAWLVHQLGEETVKRVWGFQDENKKEADQGFASFVFIEDGIVKLPEGAIVETRDGVGIDRRLGAAAESVKYDRAVLPAGTEITLDITVEFA